MRFLPATGLRPAEPGMWRRCTSMWSRSIMTKTARVLDRFDELYEGFGATIYARCRQMLRDPTAAQDATQEVFLKVHRALDRLRGSREAFTWLYRTATNHCLNELRNGRQRP